MNLRRGVTFATRAGVVCLLAATCLPAQQPITSLAAVHAISNEQAARQLPVAFQGTVTYYEPGNVDLFVQDGDNAIYVESSPDLQLVAGDRVVVEGITRASFRPDILAQRVTRLSHGSLPTAVDANFTQLITAELDCRRAKVRAVVRGANFYDDGVRKSILLDLMMAGGPVQAQVALGGTNADLLTLLDSTIEITGAVAGLFDKKNRMTGVLLEVPTFSDVRIVEPASRSPHQLELRKFDQVVQNMRIEDSSERVRVEGTITYYQQGSGLVLQDGPDALWVDTRSEEPHTVGSRVRVSGFPLARNGLIVLTRGEIENVKPGAAPPVANLTPADLVSGAHAYELASVDGELIMRVREASQDQYVIASGGHVFSAIYRHPLRSLNLPVSPMKDLQIGSHVRVTGICVLDRGDQFHGPAGSHLLLRSSDDVAVLSAPSPISVRNLVILLGMLVLVVLGVIARSLLLERKLRRQEVSKAAMVERWRTRVIDGINAAIPLKDTLVQVTELLAFKLQADFCWVQLGPEDVFGNRPALEGAGLEVLGHEIPGRSGAALGKIWVAYRSKRGKRRIPADGFENAVRLSALAIETGARYSELVRRSEVDAVTNTQNRFAFDRTLDVMIEKHRLSCSKLGLIYIDLDGFKLVNDQYGHQTGDRFLQETVLRLGHQLRTQDFLARIGGDEFAVLVSDVKSREEVAEIALRLESCFVEPFRLDVAEIEASASVGYAVFPEDATTAMDLLECADAGMYREKRKRSRERMRLAIEAERSRA